MWKAEEWKRNTIVYLRWCSQFAFSYQSIFLRTKIDTQAWIASRYTVVICHTHNLQFECAWFSNQMRLVDMRFTLHNASATVWGRKCPAKYVLDAASDNDFAVISKFVVTTTQNSWCCWKIFETTAVNILLNSTTSCKSICPLCVCVYVKPWEFIKN